MANKIEGYFLDADGFGLVGVELLAKLVLRNKPARLPEDDLQGPHVEFAMSGNREDLVASRGGYPPQLDMTSALSLDGETELGQN